MGTRRGGSNEYTQAMFWSKNKKNRYTAAFPSFTIYSGGLRGYSLHRLVSLMFFYNLSFFSILGIVIEAYHQQTIHVQEN